MAEQTVEPSAAVAPIARRPEAPILRWYLLVLGAWTGMHLLNLGLSIVTERSSPRFALGYWTCAKVLAWLLPTSLLVWRCRELGALAGWRERVRAAVRWLGLCSSRGVGAAVVWSCAWIAVQLLGRELHLPLFNQPAPELEPHRLFAALLIAPLFEELLFRGAMMRALRELGMRRAWAVLLSALAFAGLHLPGWIVHRGADPGIFASFLSIGTFGVVLGYLGSRSPSLWAPIALHAANNLFSTGALGWLTRTCF